MASQQSRNNGAAARVTVASRHVALASPRFLALFPGPLGLPHLPRQSVERSRTGDPRKRRGPRPDGDIRTTQHSHKCEKMALANCPAAAELCHAGLAQGRGEGLPRLLSLRGEILGLSRFNPRPRMLRADCVPGPALLSTSTHPGR